MRAMRVPGSSLRGRVVVTGAAVLGRGEVLRLI
jgi:hypothetical protein